MSANGSMTEIIVQ